MLTSGCNSVFVCGVLTPLYDSVCVSKASFRDCISLSLYSSSFLRLTISIKFRSIVPKPGLSGLGKKPAPPNEVVRPNELADGLSPSWF